MKQCSKRNMKSISSFHPTRCALLANIHTWSSHIQTPHCPIHIQTHDWSTFISSVSPAATSILFLITVFILKARVLVCFHLICRSFILFPTKKKKERKTISCWTLTPSSKTFDDGWWRTLTQSFKKFVHTTWLWLRVWIQILCHSDLKETWEKDENIHPSGQRESSSRNLT